MTQKPCFFINVDAVDGVDGGSWAGSNAVPVENIFTLIKQKVLHEQVEQIFK